MPVCHSVHRVGGVGFPACITGHMTSIQRGWLPSMQLSSHDQHPEGVYIHGKSPYSWVCIGGGCLLTGEVCTWGVYLQGGGSAYTGRSAYRRGLTTGGSAFGGGGLHPGGVGGGWADHLSPGTRKAGGTHPTGMLSCDMECCCFASHTLQRNL